jgi:hypothetical protein
MRRADSIAGVTVPFPGLEDSARWKVTKSIGCVNGAAITNAVMCRDRHRGRARESVFIEGRSEIRR